MRFTGRKITWARMSPLSTMMEAYENIGGHEVLERRERGPRLRTFGRTQEHEMRTTQVSEV